MPAPMIVVRRLGRDDLPGALAIQAAAYPPFLVEEADAFASRIDMVASYCLAATRDGVLVAYLLAHGWPSLSPPPVGAVLPPDAPADILFIHDLSVAAAGRGSGVGRRLVEQAFAMAGRDGLRQAELIAVEGAAPFWVRLGFVETNPSDALAAKVAAYGAQARWMSRPILV